jgi:hypothetical protein
MLSVLIPPAAQYPLAVVPHQNENGIRSRISLQKRILVIMCFLIQSGKNLHQNGSQIHFEISSPKWVLMISLMQKPIRQSSSPNDSLH